MFLTWLKVDYSKICQILSILPQWLGRFESSQICMALPHTQWTCCKLGKGAYKPVSRIALLTPVGVFNPYALGFFTLTQFKVLKIELFLHKFDLHYCLLKDSWLRKWGWHDHLAEKFATALLKSIVDVLSQTCKGTLRILDIERSRH